MPVVRKIGVLAVNYFTVLYSGTRPFFRLAMDGGKKVWAPHPEEGYQLGIIVDVGSDTLSVDPLSAPGQVSIIEAFQVVNRNEDCGIV